MSTTSGHKIENNIMQKQNNLIKCAITEKEKRNTQVRK